MSRAVRWTVAGVAALVTFGLSVAVVRALPWGWLPQEDGARLDTALAFGAVAGTAVLAGLGWWAGREQPRPAPDPVPPAPPRTVTQTATASDDARVTQTGGGAPQVEQHAEASGEASVTQTGGHLPSPSQGAGGNAPPGDLPDQVEQRARASGRGRIVQSGGDQHVDGA